MHQPKKANAPSAAAVTVMAATAVSAMVNVVSVQSALNAATMWIPLQRKHPHKPLTVVKAILPLPTAAPLKAPVLTTSKLRLPRP